MNTPSTGQACARHCLPIVLLIVGGILGAALARAGPGEADVSPLLRTQRLVLTDAAGRTRAELRADEAATSLFLTHPDGKRGLRLAVHGDGSLGVSWLDASGRSRMGMALSENGAPGVVLRDQEGNDRIGLLLERDAVPSLVLLDAGDRRRVACLALPDGEAGLMLYAEDQARVATVSAVRGGNTVVRLGPDAGQAVIEAEREGSCGLTLTDATLGAQVRVGKVAGRFGMALKGPGARADLMVGVDGADEASLVIARGGMESAVALRGGGSGPVGVLLSDSAGKGRLRLAIRDGIPVFGLLDASGQEVLAGTHDVRGGIIEVLGADGKSRWKAP